MTIVQMAQRAGSQLTNNLSNEDGFWPTCHAPTSLYDVLFSKQYNQDLFANYSDNLCSVCAGCRVCRGQRFAGLVDLFGDDFTEFEETRHFD